MIAGTVSKMGGAKLSGNGSVNQDLHQFGELRRIYCR